MATMPDMKKRRTRVERVNQIAQKKEPSSDIVYGRYLSRSRCQAWELPTKLAVRWCWRRDSCGLKGT